MIQNTSSNIDSGDFSLNLKRRRLSLQETQSFLQQRTMAFSDVLAQQSLPDNNATSSSSQALEPVHGTTEASALTTGTELLLEQLRMVELGLHQANPRR